jgi:iron complex outermembrane receptor protein
MRLVFAAVAVALVSSPAVAQRADDNAVKSADDAFGTSIGTENIGLYSPFEVRGFSAVDAGNVRIDGLYFDRQTDLTSLLAPSTTIRVGISAQGYPLPAPTGIVDNELVRVGDTRVISILAGVGPFGGTSFEVNAKLPMGERFGLAVGGAINNTAFEIGNSERFRSVAVAAQWRPVDGVEIIPFFDHVDVSDSEAQPLVFVSGTTLPPKYKRGRFFGQDWADGESQGTNYGVVVTADAPLGWTLKTGLFRSIFNSDHSYADLFLDTQPDGGADHVLVADPQQRFASTSGEVRLSRSFDEGPRRHTLHLIARGRDQDRRYGGSDAVDFGRAVVGVPVDLPEPQFNFGPRTRDSVSQWTGAVAYQGRWDALEVSLGGQRTRYRKTVREPGLAAVTGRDEAWLYNVAAAWRANDRLAFYAGYTKGLEEGGVAPANAVNKNAAPPAIHTRQVDAGFRYALTPDLRLVAGVFDVRKPYYDLDAASVYRHLGNVRHRGVELSLSGQLAKGLNVVAGTILQDPEVSGEEVDAGLIGKFPVSQTKRITILALDYQLPWFDAVSVNANVLSVGAREASRQNLLKAPPRTTLDLGARYRFKIAGAPATLRFTAANVFDQYGFRVVAGGVLIPNAQRRYSVTLAADF